MAKIEARKSDNLTDTGELAHVAIFTQQLGSGQRANALDGGEQITMLFEVRMAVDEVLDHLVDLFNLVGEKIDLLQQVIDDCRGGMGGMVERMEAITWALPVGFQVGQMAHQGLQFALCRRGGRPPRRVLGPTEIGDDIRIQPVSFVALQPAFGMFLDACLVDDIGRASTLDRKLRQVLPVASRGFRIGLDRPPDVFSRNGEPVEPSTSVVKLGLFPTSGPHAKGTQPQWLALHRPRG